MGQVLSLPREDDDALKAIALAHGLDVKELIVTAIEAKVAYWLEDAEQVEKRVKQDLMLAKLMRR